MHLTFSPLSFHENMKASLKPLLWRVIFLATTPWVCRLYIGKQISQISRNIYQTPRKHWVDGTNSLGQGFQA